MATKSTTRPTQRVKLLADYVHSRLRLLNGDMELRSAKECGDLPGKISAMAWQCSNELSFAGADLSHDETEVAIQDVCARYELRT